jgi:uncharacterized protein YggE
MKIKFKRRILTMKTNNLLNSKWSFIFVFAFAFALSFHFTSSKDLAADSSALNGTAARTINITGDGEVTAAPDIAYLSLGITIDKPTTTEAQSANSVAINNVITAIKKEGIKDEDIKTTDYSINPKYDYDKTTGASTLVGYTVSNTINVTVKDIGKAGQIIDTAVKNGANISNRISFGISDYKKYYNMALLNALSNAQGKAQVISNFLGAKLTTPVKVTENSSGIPNDYPVYPLNTKFESADSSSSTPIQAGTYKVKANISLVYEY